MDLETPPRLPSDEVRASAQRALNRGVGLGRASGVCLMVLGGISILLCLLDPLSAGMLISLAVSANGIVEWRAAGRLRVLQGDAVDVLAVNQIALGLEIGAYAVWRAQTIDVNMVDGILRQPLVASALELYPVDVVELLRERLPGVLRDGFLVAAGVAVLGCVIMTLYYRSRRKYVIRLAAPAAQA